MADSSFRVTENAIVDEAIIRTRNLANQQLTRTQRLATGQRFSKVGDDPPAVGRSLKSVAERRKLVQYSENASRAEDIVKKSYLSAGQFAFNLQRAQEIAALSNSEISSQAIQGYVGEVNGIVTQLVGLANSQYDDAYIFSGTATGTEPFTATYTGSEITSVAYNGNTNQISFHISDSVTISPFTSGDTNADLLTAINDVIEFRDALAINDYSMIITKQQDLITSHSNVAEAIAEMGSVESRAESMKIQNSLEINNINERLGYDIGTDVYETYAELSQLEVALKATTTIYPRILQTVGMLAQII